MSESHLFVGNLISSETRYDVQEVIRLADLNDLVGLMRLKISMRRNNRISQVDDLRGLTKFKVRLHYASNRLRDLDAVWTDEAA